MVELTSLGSTDVLTTTIPLLADILGGAPNSESWHCLQSPTISTSSFFAEELVACEGVCRVSVR